MRFLPFAFLLFTAPLAAQPAPLPDTTNAGTTGEANDYGAGSADTQVGAWSREAFDSLPLRTVREVAALAPGIYRDLGDGSLRYRATPGAPALRSGGVFDRARVGQRPVFVVNGVRIADEAAEQLGVPFRQVEHVEVVDGYVPARFGEAADGLVLVETRAGSDRVGGEIEGLSSGGLDGFGYALGAFAARGPVVSPRVGRFSFAGEVRSLADANPYGGASYRLSDDAYAVLAETPQVVRVTNGAEERFVPFPIEAAQAAVGSGEPFTVDDLRGVLDLPAGFDLSERDVLVNAPATFTEERFERQRAKDDPLRGVTLHGTADFGLGAGLGLHLGGAFDREAYDQTATPAERFANALYNRDGLYAAERDGGRAYVALRLRRPSGLDAEVRAEAQRWRWVQHPAAFSDDVADALFYGDIDAEANAIARRYFVVRNGAIEPLYDRDGGARPGELAGTFLLPGAPATVYRKGEGGAERLFARVAQRFGAHRVELGGELERQTHRRFELSGANLARYYADGDVEGVSDEVPPGGVQTYDALPFGVVRSGTVTRYGYNYLGIEATDSENVDAYFDGQNTDLAPYRPTYAAGWGGGTLDFGALTFDLGLRLEAFGSNANVLLDPFSPVPIVRAGTEAFGDPSSPLFQGADFAIPDGIGGDFAVYFNDAAAIVGYRDLEGQFYDATGAEASASDVTGARSGQVEQTMEAPSAAFDDAPTHVRFSPRLGVRFQVVEEATLFAYFNRLTRRPSAALYEPFASYETVTGQDALGNARLEPVTVDDLGVGGEAVWGGVLLRGAVFYRHHRDIAIRSVLPGGFPEYRTYLNRASAATRGIELQAALARTQGFAAYASYVAASSEIEGPALLAAGSTVFGEDIPSFSVPSDADVRHAFDLAADYHIDADAGPKVGGVSVFGGTSVGAVLAVQSGRPYTALTASTFSVNDPFTAPIAGGLNEARRPWTWQLDLQARKQFDVARGAVEAFVWVENVLDTRNVLAMYRATGLPGTDSFLDTTAGAAYIQNQPSPSSGTFNYLAFTGGAVNVGGAQSTEGSLFYGRPRLVRLGLRVLLR